MSMQKFYLIYCDNCGTTIQHIGGDRPTVKYLKKYHNVKFVKKKHYCDACYYKLGFDK